MCTHTCKQIDTKNTIQLNQHHNHKNQQSSTPNNPITLLKSAWPCPRVACRRISWSASAASGLALSVSRASLTALSRFFSRVAILAKSLGLFEAISKSRGNMRHKQPRHITQHTPLNTSHNMCLHLAPETVVTYDFMYTNQKPKNYETSKYPVSSIKLKKASSSLEIHNSLSSKGILLL